MKRRIYLDYAATSPLLPEVKTVMVRAMEVFGNPSAIHAFGREARELIEEARKEVARLINAEPEEIIFTSGGTEANNTVFNTFHGAKVAISEFEHPSVERAILEATKIVEFDEKPDLASVMLANNEIGTIFQVRELVRKMRNWSADENSEKTGVKRYFHTDATQAVGKVKIDVRRLGVDYLTFSAHKIGGPKGVGVLFVRKGAPLRSYFGGGHQENGRRAGTYNTLGIVGLGAAAKYARENKTWEIYDGKVRKLRDLLEKRIITEVPEVLINRVPGDRLPNISNVSFSGAEGEAIQLYLDAEGIAVSTGSACASGDGKPSKTIMALTGDAERAHSSIRFSLGLEPTEDGIDGVMRVLPRVVEKLRGFSAIKR